MNLLKEGKASNAIIATEHLKKLTIDGHSKNYIVYKIKLDMLYYNDQNDRIATWISKYKIENVIKEFDVSDKENYNNIIHKFITESNEDSIKRTQKNVRMIKQQVPGVVLCDGRIIDGNRRFTCLRNIQVEDIETGYFEAVILDRNINDNKKEIKMLELKLQHGEDEKVGYNPVDKLVGLYNDVINENSKLLTVQEYSKSVGQDEKDIKVEIEKAELMVEFLDFFNMSAQFHRISELNVIDALNELHKALKKITDEERRDDFKHTVFVQLFYYDKAKRAYVRDINKIISNNKYIDDFIEEHRETVFNVIEKICEEPELTTAKIALLKSDETTKCQLEKVTEKILTKVNSESTKNLPALQSDKVISFLENINIDIFKKLSKEQKVEIAEKLDTIEELVSEIRRGLDV